MPSCPLPIATGEAERSEAERRAAAGPPAPPARPARWPPTRAVGRGRRGAGPHRPGDGRRRTGPRASRDGGASRNKRRAALPAIAWRSGRARRVRGGRPGADGTPSPGNPAGARTRGRTGERRKRELAERELARRGVARGTATSATRRRDRRRRRRGRCRRAGGPSPGKERAGWMNPRRDRRPALGGTQWRDPGETRCRHRPNARRTSRSRRSGSTRRQGPKPRLARR